MDHQSLQGLIFKDALLDVVGGCVDQMDLGAMFQSQRPFELVLWPT